MDRAKRARVLNLFGGIAAAAVAAVWLTATASPIENQDAFLGLWRMRHALPALVAFWMAAGLTLRGLWPRAGRTYLTGSVTFGVAVLILDGLGLSGVVDYPRLLFPKPGMLGAEPMPYLDRQGESFQDIATAWGIPSKPMTFHYTTDRRGYRNAVDRTEAEVYLLGDSILVAGLVPFEDTVAGRLEAALDKPVMNIALVAIGPQEERDMLRASGLPFKDRWVLHFIFEGNDLLDSARYRDALQGEERPPLLERCFSFQVFLYLQRALNPSRYEPKLWTGHIGEQPYLFQWLEDSWRGHMDKEFDPICGALLDARTYVHDAGGRYAVVYVPAKIRVLGPSCRWPEGSALTSYEAHLNPLREQLALWCRAQNIPFVDTSEALIQCAATCSIPWFWGDSHPNGEGHRIMAETVVQWLREQ